MSFATSDKQLRKLWWLKRIHWDYSVLAKKMMKKLANDILRSPKLLYFNKLYQKRCQYDDKYEQGREKGSFDSILLAEMCPSSLLRFFLNSYSLV